MNKKSLRFQIMLLLGSALLVLTMVLVAIIYNLESLAEQKLLELDGNIRQVKKISEIKYLFGHEIQEWKNTIIRGANTETNIKH